MADSERNERRTVYIPRGGMIPNFHVGKFIRYSADHGRSDFEPRWQDRIFPGHITVGPVTFYGANAMHWAVNVRTRWGYLCVRPSDDATPTRRTWGFGPGLDR